MISIIMPCYNSADFIRESICSVIAQSYVDWELIIIDDNSSDRSLDIALEFSRLDKRIVVLNNSTNQGAAVARNIGLEAAKGRYIAFLDSDDLWCSNKLEMQTTFMRDNQVSFCYTGYYKANEAGEVLSEVRVPAKVSYWDLLKVNSIGCLTVIYDREKVGEVRMPLIRKRQDLGMWLLILKKIKFAEGLQAPTARYRVRRSSLTSSKSRAASFTWSLYYDIEKLGLFKSLYYFTHYAINGIIRTKLPRLARLLKKS